MSINVFADRRMALGFGGSIVAIAMIAGASMGAFAPKQDDAFEPQPTQVAMAETRSAPPARAGQPASTWDDDGEGGEDASDDWAGGAAAGPSGPVPESEPVATGAAPGPAFGSYNPNRSAASRQASRGGSGPIIRSRAGPNAPALKPPGND